MDARVLVVADNDDVLDGISAWLAVCPGFEVAGVAHTAREAYDRTHLHSPDIVLMSLSMPGTNGLAAARLIKARAEAPLVILMTLHDVDAVREHAAAAGADGCLSMARLIEDFPRVAGDLWRDRRVLRATVRKLETRRAPEIEG